MTSSSLCSKACASDEDERVIESYTVEMVEVNGVSIPIGREYRENIEKL